MRIDGKRVAKIIQTFITKHCPEEPLEAGTFCDPADWRARGELYGLDSVLIVVHDGGALAPFCNHDYLNHKAMHRLAKRLAKAKFYIEQCTCWYSAVYKL